MPSYLNCKGNESCLAFEVPTAPLPVLIPLFFGFVNVHNVLFAKVGCIFVLNIS